MQHRPRKRATRRIPADAGTALADIDLPDTEHQQTPRRRVAYRAQPTLSALKMLGVLRKGQHGYIEIDYDLVEQLAANGLTQAEIAEALVVSTSTVTSRLGGNTAAEADGEFKKAFARGKAQMRHLISNGIFTKAVKGDSASLFFLAKTRMAWRENEPEKAQTNPADVAAMLRDEMAKAAA
jgi:transcriptional regulator with XRE-family HTH domain